MAVQPPLPSDRDGVVCRLSADQEPLLAAARDEWARNRSITGPADRQAAEAGVCHAYQAAGLDPPQRVVWLDSPLQGTIAAAILTGLDRDVRIRDPVWDRVRAEVAAQGHATAGAGYSVRSWVGPLLWARARVEAQAQVGRRLWDQVWARTGRQIMRQPTRPRLPPMLLGLMDHVDATLGWPAMGQLWHQAVRWQLEAAWCATAAGLRRVVPSVQGLERLAGLQRTAVTAGWWWPFERAVILTERPVTVHRDQRGRLHRADGPALVFPDGFTLHAWHDMPVPAALIAQLSDVRLEDIQAELNVEHRRVLVERYGFDRYLRDVGAVQLHQDATGTLWRADLPGDEPLVMVEVLNATPEPGGTHRTYWLRVPPRVRTAREGVAWTFGQAPDQYQPVRET